MRPSSAETSEPAWVNRKMLSMKSSTSWFSSSRKYSAAVRPVRATRRRGPMDRIRLLGLDRRALVDGLADDVEDPPEGFVADGNGDGRAGIGHRHPAREPLGRRHGHGADLALAEVLRDLQHEPLRVR